MRLKRDLETHWCLGLTAIQADGGLAVLYSTTTYAQLAKKKQKNTQNWSHLWWEMDPSTSAFITQKALRYGLHCCSYYQAVLIDLTPLAHSGSQGDSVIEPKKASDDRSVLLFYKDRLFHQFHFSQLTVSKASLTCPLFELLHETGFDDGDWFINLDLSSKRFGVHPSGSYHLRLSTGMSSLILSNSLIDG